MRPACAPRLVAVVIALSAAGCGSTRSRFERGIHRELDRLREEKLAVERELERMAEAALAEERARAEVEDRRLAAEAQARRRAAEAERDEPGPAAETVGPEAAGPASSAVAVDESAAVDEMRAALAAAKDQDLATAAAHAENALRLRPGFVDPLMLLAAISEQGGDFEGARERYLDVLRSDPTLVAAGNAIGFTYLTQGSFDQATEWFRKSIDADPGFEAAAYNLGSVAEQKGEFDSAAAWFEVSAALDRRDPRPLARIAHIRLEQRRPEDALAAAEAALARYPTSQSAREMRAAALRVLGRTQ